jgi:hypothetical protein
LIVDFLSWIDRPLPKVQPSQNPTGKDKMMLATIIDIRRMCMAQLHRSKSEVVEQVLFQKAEATGCLPGPRPAFRTSRIAILSEPDAPARD